MEWDRHLNNEKKNNYDICKNITKIIVGIPLLSGGKSFFHACVDLVSPLTRHKQILKATFSEKLYYTLVNRFKSSLSLISPLLNTPPI